MRCNKSFYLNKTVRIFPVRLSFCLICVSCFYIFYEIYARVSAKVEEMPIKVPQLSKIYSKKLKSDENNISYYFYTSEPDLQVVSSFWTDENTLNGYEVDQNFEWKSNTNQIRNSSKKTKLVGATSTKPLQTESKLFSQNRLLVSDSEGLQTSYGRKTKLVGATSSKSLQTESKLFSQSRLLVSDSEGLRASYDDYCEIKSFGDYVQCKDKIKWLMEKWSSDPCYAEWGVNGSTCSIVRYLSEVESWCPKLPEHTKQVSLYSLNIPQQFKPLSVRDNFDELYNKLGTDITFKWIRKRIERMEYKWLKAARELASKYNVAKCEKKKILIHIGALNPNNGWNFAEDSFNGGPLGELVQWSDIISCLYILGHDITLSVSANNLSKQLKKHLNSIQNHTCPPKKNLFNLIYTDISGMATIKRLSASRFHILHCVLRVVDSFGTEPAFNNPEFAIRNYKSSSWGKWDLHPGQFNTMFPHTPDNTFLGFVNEEINAIKSVNKREKNAVVYGKKDNFWKDKRGYLDVLNETFQLHGTVGDNNTTLKHVPSYVINHGVLPGSQLHQLLQSAKVFVGMGFPYEGPAPLEAIAHGAVFLNPIFKRDSNFCKIVNDFYKDKPTSRRPKSQHPYAMKFIGPPHVYSVDIDDTASLRKTVDQILHDPPIEGYIPYEFTCPGTLERMLFLVEKQEFCYKKSPWPPLSAMKTVISDDQSSCAEACSKQGYICEPNFFTNLNNHSAFKILGVNCDKYLSPSANDESTDYPSFDNNTCFLQSNNKLFSCAGQETQTRRLCPCRDFVKGQVALCKDCYTL